MARRVKARPRIMIFVGDHLTVTHAPQMRLIIGRHPHCHLRIKHREINLKHAVVERIDVQDRWRLINFGTKIPTLFNGEMMEAEERRDLSPGDLFEIADYSFYFERVSKHAQPLHRERYDQLIEAESNKDKKRFEVIDAEEDDEEFADGVIAGDGSSTEVLDESDGDDDAGEQGAPEGIKIRSRRRGRRLGARRRRL